MSLTYNAGMLFVLGADNTIVNYLEQAGVFPATQEELMSISYSKDKALPRHLIYTAKEENNQFLWESDSGVDSLTQIEEGGENQIRYIFTKNNILHVLYYTDGGRPLGGLCKSATNPTTSFVEAFKGEKINDGKFRFTIRGTYFTPENELKIGEHFDEQTFFIDEKGRVTEESTAAGTTRYEFLGDNLQPAKISYAPLVEKQLLPFAITQLTRFDEKGFPTNVVFPADAISSTLVNWYDAKGRLEMVEGRMEGNDFIFLDLSAFWALRDSKVEA